MTRFLAFILAVVGGYYLYTQLAIDRSAITLQLMEELGDANRLALRMTQPTLVAANADAFADAVARVLELDSKLDHLGPSRDEDPDQRAALEALKLKFVELNQRVDQSAAYWAMSPERREKYRGSSADELFR
jgi:hypothetical protein